MTEAGKRKEQEQGEIQQKLITNMPGDARKLSFGLVDNRHARRCQSCVGAAPAVVVNVSKALDIFVLAPFCQTDQPVFHSPWP